MKKKNGKTYLEEVDVVANDAEGRIGVYPDMIHLGAPRLCFILKEEIE